HEAAVERQLLARKPVGQRLEQRGEALRPQPRAATSHLGEAGLAAKPAEERAQLDIEREKSGHERGDRPSIASVRGRDLERDRVAMLMAADERRALSEDDDARPG